MSKSKELEKFREVLKEVGASESEMKAALADEKRALKEGESDGHADMFDSSDVFNILRQQGKPRSLSNTNPMHWYLGAWPGYPDPSVLDIRLRGHVEYAPFQEFLFSTGWELVWLDSTYQTKQMERPESAIFINKEHPGYMIAANMDWILESTKRKKNYKKIEPSVFAGSIRKHPAYAYTEGDVVRIDDIDFYTPARTGPLWKPELIESLLDFLESIEKPAKVQDSEVNIIVSKGGQYDVRSFSLEDAMTNFDFPDLHYGEGFEAFHTSLMGRIEEESKGLILFHGEPGTGKTQYIRHLLKELRGANKAVLYSPPAVSASLAEPDMINFISDWIVSEQRDCILLIEDAEPLLESRSGGVDGRSAGISNLLNMTDGILNDILGLMVIATFNIEISKIDPALLRPGRLIARKEFKKLSEDQCKKLSEALNSPLPDKPSYPLSLAEFYNNRMAKNIITHEYTEAKPRIGFKG